MVMYFEYINKKIIILKYFYMCLIQFNNVFIVLMRYLVRNLSLKELIRLYSDVASEGSPELEIYP